jgi:hypothetical protein
VDQQERSVNVSRVNDFVLKSHRNVSKQTNPLKAKDLITNKSLTALEASRRILDTYWVKSTVLANMNIL